MFKKDRVLYLLDTALQEMKVLNEMSKDISMPDDFLTSISGLTVFRACGMSIQYITESFVKIRNLCGNGFFQSYKSVPWTSVFGMRNFLSHEYGDVDAEGFFNTVKTSIPTLLHVTEIIRKDLLDGKLDSYLADENN